MHTDSSASITYFASASASEWIATVLMPTSRQVRWMRSAISPRLAIRIFSNISSRSRLRWRGRSGEGGGLFEDHHDLAVLDGSAVFDEDLRQASGARRADLIHHLHRLDDEQRLTRA